MSRTLSPHELQSLLTQSEKLILLDVRRTVDYNADTAKVLGAIWHDPARVAEWSAELPRDKDIVLYCARGGGVSNSVLDHLLKQGLTARYIDGGIEAWKTAGGATAEK